MKSIGNLSPELRDAVRAICKAATAEANRNGRERFGQSWSPDIEPCVNGGGYCHACMTKAKEAAE